MSQYDFGTIDPFVVDGTTLAGMLNNWRDALYSLHRGSTRPDYAVPGMLWINDVGGPTNWVVNMYLGPSVGDRPILQVNTTTGAIAQVADQLTAALIAAQGAASPGYVWNATGNAANQRLWRAVLLPSSVLQFQALDDTQAVLNAIDFNRDGTMRVVAPAAGDSSSLVPTTAWVKANASVGGVATPTYDATSTLMSDAGGFSQPMLITQGVQVFSRSFTAVDASHPIEVDISGGCGANVANSPALALFIDGATTCVAMQTATINNGWYGPPTRVYWQGVLSAGPHTFSVRFAGTGAGTTAYLNGTNTGQLGGGTSRTTMTIREIGIGAVGPQGPPGPSGGPVTAPSWDTNNSYMTDAGGWGFGTVVQITQGTQLFSRSFTAADATHPIEVDCGITFGAGGAVNHGTVALFIDGQANAVAQQTVTINTQWFASPARLLWRGVLAAGAHTFSIRFVGVTGVYVLRNDASVMANAATYNYLKISESGVGPIGPQGPAGPGGATRTYDEYTSAAGLSSVVNTNDTIPLATAGTQILTRTINVVNGQRVRARFQGQFSAAGNASMVAFLTRSGSANALRSTFATVPSAGAGSPIFLEYEDAPGAGSFTYGVRAGPNVAGTMWFNSTQGNRVFGGTSAATLTLEVFTP